MRKRELQAGIAAGVLWVWWIMLTVDPELLLFLVRKMNMAVTPLGLELIGPPAVAVVLILGLLMNRKAIVGFGCLTMIGLDLWRLSRIPQINSLALAFTGSRSLLIISWLTEVICFLVLLLLLARPEEPGARIRTASVLALAGQILSVLGPGHSRMLRNSELLIPGAIIYVTAVAATGMYCAGLKPEMLNEFFRKSRAAGSSGSGYRNSRNSRNSHRGGVSREEEIRKDRGTASEEKRERIRKLKELRDNGIMTKEEYDQMVDKIMRS